MTWLTAFLLFPFALAVLRGKDRAWLLLAATAALVPLTAWRESVGLTLLCWVALVCAAILLPRRA